jgi:hypothetical protein
MSDQEPQKPESNSGFDVGTILFLELITGAFIGILLYFYLFPSQVKDQTCMLLLVLGYAGFVFWIMASTHEKACPVCNRVFARELVWTQELDRRKGYKTVEREEKNRNGDVVRRWNEQVRVLTISYEDRYACNNCGERWSVKRQREYDSFDE